MPRSEVLCDKKILVRDHHTHVGTPHEDRDDWSSRPPKAVACEEKKSSVDDNRTDCVERASADRAVSFLPTVYTEGEMPDLRIKGQVC
jgi:hypothetical protein